uniref:LAGLIDADG_2 domain-containing protein n=1 Tax=Strongyloides venezuelensis TaxID=75913 RepID=A0A0K0EVY1_STRVS
MDHQIRNKDGLAKRMVERIWVYENKPLLGKVSVGRPQKHLAEWFKNIKVKDDVNKRKNLKWFQLVNCKYKWKFHLNSNQLTKFYKI